jgi:hypothetical protein
MARELNGERSSKMRARGADEKTFFISRERDGKISCERFFISSFLFYFFGGGAGIEGKCINK